MSQKVQTRALFVRQPEVHGSEPMAAYILELIDIFSSFSPLFFLPNCRILLEIKFQSNLSLLAQHLPELRECSYGDASR